MKPAKLLATALLPIALMLASCVIVPTNSHVNLSDADSRLPAPSPSSAAYIASVDVVHDVDWRCRNQWSGSPPERSIDQCRAIPSRRDPNFIALALSGGGSRAAVFSAAVMFELQKQGILQQVDVLSSASGGSVSAALYAVSCDDGQACAPPVTPNLNRTVWKESIIYPLLQSNYIDRWRINCWRPENIVRYATYFDRTDVMAETFAEGLFGGTREPEKSFLFRDLNPQKALSHPQLDQQHRQRRCAGDLQLHREGFFGHPLQAGPFPRRLRRNGLGGLPRRLPLRDTA